MYTLIIHQVGDIAANVRVQMACMQQKHAEFGSAADLYGRDARHSILEADRDIFRCIACIYVHSASTHANGRGGRGV